MRSSRSLRLQSLVRGSGIDLGAKVGSRCTSSGEVASKDWLDEGAEDNLGTAAVAISDWIVDDGIINSPGSWEGQPEDKNELEGVVEWEPINGADRTLENCQEGEDNPVLGQSQSSPESRLGNGHTVSH